MCVPAVLACAASVVPAAGSPVAGALAASAPPPRAMSQAGYAVTGAHFQTVESWVQLPDPARFARYAGRVSVSAQLWSARLLFDLRFTACTNRHCRPGSGPAVHSYRMEFTVYRRSTGAVVCSTAAAGVSRCPDTGRNWATQRCRPGSAAQLALVNQDLSLDAYIGGSGCQAHYNYYPAASRADIAQARLGVEFGATPWASGPIRSPARLVAVATFDRPPPPPDAAEVGTVGGSTGGIASPHWARHAVEATGAKDRVQARPGRLFDDGYGFTVYLEP